MKFSKFIDRLRSKFSTLFDELLSRQLALKGICSLDEWEELKEKIHYDFLKDNNFYELKEAELLQNRLAILVQVDPYIGRFFSKKWVQENVLHMDEDEIERMQEEMDEEYEQRNGNEKQLREIVRTAESQPGIRVDKGELHEGVHSGLHKPNESTKVPKRKTILGNRSEGKVLARGRSEVASSKTRQPKHEVGVSVSTTRSKGERKEVSDVSQVGNQTRLHSSGDKRTRQDSKRRATLGGSEKKESATGLDMAAIMKRAEELL